MHTCSRNFSHHAMVRALPWGVPSFPSATHRQGTPPAYLALWRQRAPPCFLPLATCPRCYLVAAATRPALSACLSLRLPCYNATHLLLPPPVAQQLPPSDSASANATANGNGTQPYARWLPYMSGTWTKLLVIGEVLGAAAGRGAPLQRP